MSTDKLKARTVGELLDEGRRRLAAYSENPAADARVLLSHISGLDAAALAARPERELEAALLQAWEDGLFMLEAGSPLPYVLGEWEFFGLPFGVAPAALIPRPETELLVETAIRWLRAHPGRRRLADVGVGSGAIAVALAVSIEDVQVTATDISADALAVAESNARRHAVGGRVDLVKADLLAGVDGPFDLICANLPYVPSGRLPQLDVAKREPVLALDGGGDGLDLVRRLLAQAPERLAPGGLLLAEVDDSHETSAVALAAEYFPEAAIELRRDLADKPRLLVVHT